jgi:predicted nucleotidyltransferase
VCFEIVELGNYLEDLLGVKAVVMMRDGLKEYLAPLVRREVQYV